MTTAVPSAASSSSCSGSDSARCSILSIDPRGGREAFSAASVASSDSMSRTCTATGHPCACACATVSASSSRLYDSAMIFTCPSRTSPISSPWRHPSSIAAFRFLAPTIASTRWRIAPSARSWASSRISAGPLRALASVTDVTPSAASARLTRVIAPCIVAESSRGTRSSRGSASSRRPPACSPAARDGRRRARAAPARGRCTRPRGRCAHGSRSGDASRRGRGPRVSVTPSRAESGRRSRKPRSQEPAGSCPAAVRIRSTISPLERVPARSVETIAAAIARRCRCGSTKPGTVKA